MATILSQLSQEIGEEVTADEFRAFLGTLREGQTQKDKEQCLSSIAEITQELATPKQLRMQELQSEMNTLMYELQTLVEVRDAYQVELTDTVEIPTVEEVRVEFERRLKEPAEG